jgi:hypothetical protein
VPTEARRFLEVPEGKAASGEPVLRRANPVRYEEAAKDLRAHYEATGTRELSEYTYRVAHLARFTSSARRTFRTWRGGFRAQSRAQSRYR